jgi:hypothetical protein
MGWGEVGWARQQLWLKMMLWLLRYPRSASPAWSRVCEDTQSVLKAPYPGPFSGRVTSADSGL